MICCLFNMRGLCSSQGQLTRLNGLGHVITVNGEIIDSLMIDIDAGTLESRAFSEQTPAAVWRTQRIPAGASP